MSLRVCKTFSTTASQKIISSQVLSRENQERTVKVLSTLKPIRTGKLVSKRRAAILVPLCTVDEEISLLFTVRSMRLKSNRGQVAFPGGMEDSDDKSLLETALRETNEEVGIQPGNVEIWGPGPAIGRDEMMVTPYLGYVGQINPNHLQINSEEVEKAFSVPLSTLCDSDNFKTTEFRSKQGHYVLPIFMTPTFRTWGLTAIITHIILSALLPAAYKNKLKRQVLTSSNLPSTKPS